MNENNTIEIDLLELFTVFLQKWWIIILSAVGTGIVAFLFTYLFIVPTYSANVLMYVNNSSVSIGSASVSITSGDILAAKTLVSTYGVVLNTRLTLEEVIEKTGIDYTYEELKEMITSQAVNNTEVFSVTVESHDPEEACLIANTIADVLPQKIAKVVEGSSVRVVDLAVVPTHRSSPSYSRSIVIGMLLGIIASAGVICLGYVFNDKLMSEQWLLENWKDEIPLLSVIPDVNDKRSGRYSRYSDYEYRQNSASTK